MKKIKKGLSLGVSIGVGILFSPFIILITILLCLYDIGIEDARDYEKEPIANWEHLGSWLDNIWDEDWNLTYSEFEKKNGCDPYEKIRRNRSK